MALRRRFWDRLPLWLAGGALMRWLHHSSGNALASYNRRAKVFGPGWDHDAMFPDV